MKTSLKHALRNVTFSMRQLLLSVTASCLFLSIAASVLAIIEGSPHDLSTKQCNVCHADHLDAGQNPAWELYRKSEHFALYHSSIHDGNNSRESESPSSFCLGCHNGILSEFIENRGASPTSDMEYYEKPLNSFSNTETNPWNNHPVGFIYKPGNDADNNNFPPIVSIPGNAGGRAIFGKKTGTYYPLYGIDQNQFECTTCHIAHDPVDQSVKGTCNGHLLRAESKMSSICKDCHRNKY